MNAADARRTVTRIIYGGFAAIVVALILGVVLLFLSLPAANSFEDQIARIFAENDLTSDSEIALLEILAQSGTTFSEVITSYQGVIFVLLVLATALLLASLIFLVVIIALNRRIAEIERAGIQVSSLVIRRDERLVSLNNMDFSLTPAAIETMSVLAEARMDEDVLSGAEIEAMISGKNAADCDEASGATRIKRLRDALGNQMVSELLIKNIARKGYVLDIRKEAIQMK